MKVWPIDPLVPRNLRLEVPEKLMCVAFDDELRVTRQSSLLRGRHCQIAGKALFAQTTAARLKGPGAHRGNDPGDGNNV